MLILPIFSPPSLSAGPMTVLILNLLILPSPLISSQIKNELVEICNDLFYISEAPRPQGGASRKGNLIYIVPLDPAYKAGLAGHLPVN